MAERLCSSPDGEENKPASTGTVTNNHLDRLDKHHTPVYRKPNNIYLLCFLNTCARNENRDNTDYEVSFSWFPIGFVCSLSSLSTTGHDLDAVMFVSPCIPEVEGVQSLPSGVFL